MPLRLCLREVKASDLMSPTNTTSNSSRPYMFLVVFFFLGATAEMRPRLPHFLRFLDHTQLDTHTHTQLDTHTHGTAPVNE